MKKKVLFVAALFIGATAFAQDGLTSKKGEAYLPEAGDWALGFDGTPFLNYAGNLFNGNTSNSVNATWVGNTPQWTIVGKMFKDETTAYRMKVRIGFGSTSSDLIFEDDITDPSTAAAPIEFTNESSTSNFNITLGGGIEKRRGNTRIQGFYGAEALITLGSSSTEETYGRDLSQFFTGGSDNTTTSNGFAARVTETTAGSTFSFGLRGFIGVEWFVFPKVSVSAEYGWGLALSSTGEGDQTVEFWGISEAQTASILNGGAAVADHIETKETKTGGSSSFGLDTDNNGGVITIMFHF